MKLQFIHEVLASRCVTLAAASPSWGNQGIV